MNKSELIKAYSKYEYNATLSYGEGKAYVESNHPFFLIYIQYDGDGFITPNTNDIKMQIKSKPNSIFFKLLSFTKPESHLFDYFGTIRINRARIYGLGGSKANISIKSPNYDYPEIMETNPEDFSRLPEDVKKVFTYTNKDNLQFYEEAKASKAAKKSRQTRTGKATVGFAGQSSRSSGGSGY
tara:strand:- start:40 stop:588 length:549 start_codon:yes stop_codon:yes gene_type:complete